MTTQLIGTEFVTKTAAAERGETIALRASIAGRRDARRNRRVARAI